MKPECRMLRSESGGLVEDRTRQVVRKILQAPSRILSGAAVLFSLSLLIVALALSIGLQPAPAAESVISSKHNLSVSGPGDIRATLESDICIF